MLKTAQRFSVLSPNRSPLFSTTPPLPSVAISPTPISQSTVNNLRIASFDHHLPTAALSLIINAAPRHSPNTALPHFLKNSFFKSTKLRSPFGLTSQCDLRGIQLYSQLSRDHLSISAFCLRDDIEFATELLTEVATQTAFHHYEFPQVQELVEYETLCADSVPETKALELLFQTAYRSGIARSLYAPDFANVSSKEVATFAASACVAENMGLAAIGVEHEKLTQFVKNLPSGKPLQSAKSVYYGGEMRLSYASNAFVVAFNGNVSNEEKAALLVLKYLVGGNQTKYVQSSSLLKSAGVKAQVSIAECSDAALFAIEFDPNTSAAGVKKALDSLRNIKSVTDAELKRIVTQTKLEISDSGRKVELARLGNKVMGLESSLNVESLDKVKAIDIVNVARKVFGSKMTVVALGETDKLPFADQI